MKFPDNCIDLRRSIKVAGIVMNNLSLYQKHQCVSTFARHRFRLGLLPGQVSISSQSREAKEIVGNFQREPGRLCYLRECVSQLLQAPLLLKLELLKDKNANAYVRRPRFLICSFRLPPFSI